MKQKLTTIILLSLLFMAGNLWAGSHKIIYVHGLKAKSYTDCQGKTKCYGGWNQQLSASNIIHTGYFTWANPTENYSKNGKNQLLANLNTYCRRDKNQSCEIVCGSMGCYTSSFVLANYNRSNIYNVHNVRALASAEGGSEVANIGTGVVMTLASKLPFPLNGLMSWLVGKSSLRALMTSYARGRWDHNRNNGTIFYHKAGRKSLWPLNWIWPGDHDRMVAFHSACGYRSIQKYTGGCGGENVKIRWICTKRMRRKGKCHRYYAPFTGHKASLTVYKGVVNGAQHGFFSKNKNYHNK